MQARVLGNDKVYAVGYGAMGFSHGYGESPSKEEAIRLIRLASDLVPEGLKLHVDTAEVYGSGHNEELLREALNPIRSKISLATKLFLLDAEEIEAQIRDHLDKSFKRLGVDFVELYYLHRAPENIPLGEVAQVMGKLIHEKKIGGWGLSQVSAQQIKLAHSITPLTAIQSEYSIMERMFEKDVIPLCQELGIAFVAFSPMASGFLSADPNYVKPADNYKGDDVRRGITRYTEKNVASNQPLLDMLFKVSSEKGITPAQVSLAWMLNKYDNVIPIPGMRKESRVIENLGAAKVVLSAEEKAALDKKLDTITIHGNRTDADIRKLGYIRQSQETQERGS